MSYRGLKRVLGETNLERKLRFLFGGVLLLLIAGSFWWYGTQTEKLVTKQNKTRGQLLVDTLLIQRHGERLRSESDKQLFEYLSNNLKRNEYQSDFLRPFATTDEQGHASGPRDDTGHALDAFEFDLLSRIMAAGRRPPVEAAQTGPATDPAHEAGDGSFAARDLPKRDQLDAHLRWNERNVDGGDYYQYFEAVYADAQCVGCHKTTVSKTIPAHASLREGDLMAVARVQISNKLTKGDIRENRAVLASAAIITVFLAMIASYVIVRYVIAKPLKHLRDVSDAVSHGNIDKRAEISTGDEFEDLGSAFNRMLRHLVTIQDELRHANSALDVKVDELAQVNLQLFEMNRMKSDFLATMSHELRTPLNSIIGFSDVLGSIASLDDKQKRYVNNIQKSGKMLLDMINDILDLAKMESGKAELRLSDFRVEHVVAAQCDMARPLAEKKNIDLEIDVDPGLAPLYQDQAKLQQILNNLLSNAIKFTPEGGRIVVSARPGTGDTVQLVVADTGVGIAEEDQHVVFDKFRQGRAAFPGGDAMTREFSGTGLGLSIVKELCKLLGGEVTLESELGRGSTFTVTVPLTITAEPRVETPLSDGVDELTKPRRIEYERGLARPA